MEFDEGRLILRPLALNCGVQLIAVGANEMPSDLLVGRVCLLVHEI